MQHNKNIILVRTVNRRARHFLFSNVSSDTVCFMCLLTLRSTIPRPFLIFLFFSFKDECNIIQVVFKEAWQ